MLKNSTQLQTHLDSLLEKVAAIYLSEEAPEIAMHPGNEIVQLRLSLDETRGIRQESSIIDHSSSAIKLDQLGGYRILSSMITAN